MNKAWAVIAFPVMIAASPALPTLTPDEESMSSSIMLAWYIAEKCGDGALLGDYPIRLRTFLSQHQDKKGRNPYVVQVNTAHLLYEASLVSEGRAVMCHKFRVSSKDRAAYDWSLIEKVHSKSGH